MDLMLKNIELLVFSLTLVREKQEYLMLIKIGSLESRLDTMLIQHLMWQRKTLECFLMSQRSFLK